VNTTISFDWYIDEIANPVDSDEVYLQVQVGAGGTRTIYYFLGGERTYAQNSSYYIYYFLDYSLKSWNSFSRNITNDVYAATGVIPTQFQTAEFYLHSRSMEYTRYFLDDFYLINGTDVIIGGSVGNGNFESGGSWTWSSPTDSSIITQSSNSTSGLWSLNASVYSNGNLSQARFSFQSDVRLTELNQDKFSFSWNIADWTIATDETYAYAVISGHNRTEDMTIYYPIAYGSTPSMFVSADYMFNVTDFNATDSWKTFTTSIFHDINTLTTTDELSINEVEFRVYSRESGANISVLFDDVILECAILNARGFEDQPDVGQPVQIDVSGYSESPYFLVTDTAYDGAKAANLTLMSDESYGYYRDFAYLPLNTETDLYFEFVWMLQNFTPLDGSEIYFQFYFDDEKSIQYLIANGSGESGDGGDVQVEIEEHNSIGGWSVARMNLFQDYYTYFGHLPNTSIYEMSFDAYSVTGGEIRLLLDDVYMYFDSAPDIQNLVQDPVTPHAFMNVEISADIIDVGSTENSIFYRVNSGNWVSISMTNTVGNTFVGTIPGQSFNSFVEYYLLANDSIGQVTILRDGLQYFSYTVAESTTTSTTFSCSCTTTTSVCTCSTIETTSTTTTTSGSPNGFLDPTLLLIIALVVGAVVVVIIIVVVKKR
jgi:hypothetical protein